VQKQIQGGVDGTVKETPKENSPVFKKCVYTLVGNNDQSLDVSAAKARELGYTPVVMYSGLEGEDIFPAWENGVLFTITETDDPVTFNLPSLSEGGELPSMTQYNIKNTVSFDASKWRTALGAYGFSKCVAVQNNDGVWGDYRINGPEWIS